MSSDTITNERLDELIAICEQTISPPDMMVDTIDTHVALRELRALREWQPIETAPKGYPSLGDPSEWFLARGTKYAWPRGSEVAVIRRIFGVGFGPWEGSGEEYYKEDFFSHWMPLPAAPSVTIEGEKG